MTRPDDTVARSVAQYRELVDFHKRCGAAGGYRNYPAALAVYEAIQSRGLTLIEFRRLYLSDVPHLEVRCALDEFGCRGWADSRRSEIKRRIAAILHLEHLLAVPRHRRSTWQRWLYKLVRRIYLWNRRMA